MTNTEQNNSSQATVNCLFSCTMNKSRYGTWYLTDECFSASSGYMIFRNMELAENYGKSLSKQPVHIEDGGEGNSVKKGRSAQRCTG